MKRILIASTIILIIGLLAAIPALAGPVSKRQHQQIKRIRLGVADGSLSRNEFQRLMHEQRKIRRLQRRAWSDGRLSPRERGRLLARLDRASRHIYRLKHNDIWARAHYRSDRNDRFGYRGMRLW